MHSIQPQNETFEVFSTIKCRNTVGKCQ